MKSSHQRFGGYFFVLSRDGAAVLADSENVSNIPMTGAHTGPRAPERSCQMKAVQCHFEITVRGRAERYR